MSIFFFYSFSRSQYDNPYTQQTFMYHNQSVISFQGRTALWDALLLLCHRIKVGYGGIVRGVHLGSSAFNILPILEVNDESWIDVTMHFFSPTLLVWILVRSSLPTSYSLSNVVLTAYHINCGCWWLHMLFSPALIRV